MSRTFGLARNRTFGATLLLTLLAFVPCTHAATFKLLHSFTGSLESDGGNPAAAMVIDANGNLYGTTDYNTGTVFRLAPDGSVEVLHVFSGTDGDEPGGLVMDGKGNLWGTTVYGGSADAGVIFEIDRTGKEKTVYTFRGAPKDGAAPVAALDKGDDGNFYGTTTVGGKENYGTAFSLTTGDHETLLHSFRLGRGGNYPLAGLLTDGNGNSYGANESGGAKDSGTVFKLDRVGRKQCFTPSKDRRTTPANLAAR